MADWRFWEAKHRGALVAQFLSRAWRSSPPPIQFSSPDLLCIAPVLLDSPVAPLVWNKLRTTSPDPLLLGQFHDAYRFSNLRSEMRALDLKNVLAKLQSAGIEPIVHKGWATARLYPQPGMRSYSDIDLLVQPKQITATRAALAVPPGISCSIDLEHSELTVLDSVSWTDLQHRSRLVQLGSTNVRILGPEDHLRSLCIHCLKHGVASPLWLVDVAVAIEGASREFDWDLCIGTRQPQANWVRSALALAHRLLEADIHNAPVAEFLPKLPGWLVRSVLRRWSRPPVATPLPRLASVLRRQTGVLEALAWRWPSAGQTTVDANASFTRIPNIHLQLLALLAPSRFKAFISDLPAVWRSAKSARAGTRASRD